MPATRSVRVFLFHLLTAGLVIASSCIVAADFGPRAGGALMIEQALEIGPVGIANHVPASMPFDITYTILKPTMSDQLFYADEELIERRTTTKPQSGRQTFRYQAGLVEGETRLFRFCVDEDTASPACGFAEVSGREPPDGADVPESFSSGDLAEHYQAIANCRPVCGYYSNIHYGDPSVSWMPDRGDGEMDGLRMDLYYSTDDGQLGSTAAWNTLVIYAHSAGSNKESLLTRSQSLLKSLLSIAGSGSGLVVAAVDFRHPLKQLENDLTPSSVADLSYAIQFARYHAAALHIDADDIFLVGTSLGAGVAVHAGVQEIANPSDSSPVRRHSSSVRGVITRDAQTSFSPQWFGANFLEPPVAERYQRSLLEDEERLIYGHAPAHVTSDSPFMELLYIGDFIQHKVTTAEYLGRKVDLVHLPNYGLAMEAQYRLHELEARIRVTDGYRGNFNRDAARFVAEHRLNKH